jgi:hypothetical protein
MQEQVLARIEQLILQGQSFTHHYGTDDDYWVKDITRAQSWISSATNAILQVVPSESFYCAEIGRLTTHAELKNGIPNNLLLKVLGVLESVRTEAEAGLLVKLEYQIFATAFDDFLDHAFGFHKSGKVKEAAILVSVVLEDAIKRIAEKNGIASNGLSLEPLIDKLSNSQIFTTVKAKRIKSYVGVRNTALHAEWDKLDLKDIGNAIEGVRELLDSYL